MPKGYLLVLLKNVIYNLYSKLVIISLMPLVVIFLAAVNVLHAPVHRLSCAV